MEQPDIIGCIGQRKSNKYSQGGEDGILEAIFERIGIDNKWCFEAGAGDGILFSNTRKLIEEGWNAVLVESDEQVFKRLVSNLGEFASLCHCENVLVEPSGYSTLDKILKRNNAPIEIDLLSLDIDGQDYHVFNSLMQYKPRVVVIEYALEPGKSEFIPTVGGEGQAGKKAIENLLYGRSYRPIFSTHTNIIAVRSDLEAKLLGDTIDVEVKDAPVKLNLGCGDVVPEGYTNIDRKLGLEAYPLTCEDNSVDEIRASHILEHFGHHKLREVLLNWVSKLKPGGVLKIAVPDYADVSRRYLSGEKINTQLYICGGQLDDDDYHKSIFDKASLSAILDSVGLKDIKHWESEVRDCAVLPISLNLQGTKRPAVIVSQEEVDQCLNECRKLGAVMSMPRLTFADNMHTAARVFYELQIALTRGTGAFWGQVLTNMIEEHIESGAELIFTLDYDTWFTRDHAVRLLQLMAENPDVDAIIPVQSKRQGDEPLIGMRDKDGNVLERIDRKVFDCELTPVGTGHFGLTLFRASALKKLKKPWFWAQPGPDGRWQEGRQDADIYFWNQFFEQGFKAVQANKVVIGHMQLMCTFPDTAENGFKPIHLHMGEIEKGKIPEHCKPNVTFIKE